MSEKGQIILGSDGIYSCLKEAGFSKYSFIPDYSHLHLPPHTPTGAKILKLVSNLFIHHENQVQESWSEQQCLLQLFPGRLILPVKPINTSHTLPDSRETSQWAPVWWCMLCCRDLCFSDTTLQRCPRVGTGVKDQREHRKWWKEGGELKHEKTQTTFLSLNYHCP